jgi:hypothetical protein
MSELGSNKGQDEDKNTPIFDSSELEAKQKADHFANIEDVEARKKEAERKAREAEKKAEAEHEGAVREAAKKADKEARGSKGGIWNLLFGGWHKWVTIAIICILVVGLIFALCRISGGDESFNSRDEAAKSLAQEKYEEAESKRLGGSFEEAKKVFEDSIEKCSREEKIYLTVEYAKYIAKHQYKAIEAYALIDGIRADAKTDAEKDAINAGYYLIEVYTGVAHEE